MEDDSRRSKVAMKRKRNRLPSGSTSVHDLSDDLLVLVLLGIDSPVSLVRAAATCNRWRRVVAGTDGAFLRRFRSLHASPAIGTYYSINLDTPCSYGRFHLWREVDPVYVPSSESASDGPSGFQLSLDFVPPADPPKELVDGRGSLLLLLKEKDGTKLPYPSCMCCDHRCDEIIPDLVVCEPLTRRYQVIPPPENRVCILGAFLLAGVADEASSFVLSSFFLASCIDPSTAMASSAASALRAVIAVAVFTMLVMSCRGHPKMGPLCSDCASQCSNNCSAVAAANCSSFCNPPPGCDSCKTVVVPSCQDCCNSNGTSALSCCDNGCIGDCGTCGCTSCDVVPIKCRSACNPNYSGCQACSDAVLQLCNTPCNSACNENCVKKEKDC